MDDTWMDRVMFGMLAIFCGVFLLFVVSIPIIVYNCGCAKAKIFNAEYGTSYTCSDMVWADDTIESTIKGKKVRIGLEE